MKSRRKETRERADLGTRWQFTGRFGTFEGSKKNRFDFQKTLPDPRERCAIAAWQFGSAVPEEAAASTRTRDDLIDEFVEQPRDRIVDATGRRQRRRESRRAQLGIAIDGEQEQAMLAFERRVKAGPTQARRGAQIVERGRFVAPALKHVHRAIERGRGIEFTGTGHVAYLPRQIAADQVRTASSA